MDQSLQTMSKHEIPKKKPAKKAELFVDESVRAVVLVNLLEFNRLLAVPIHVHMRRKRKNIVRVIADDDHRRCHVLDLRLPQCIGQVIAVRQMNENNGKRLAHQTLASDRSQISTTSSPSPSVFGLAGSFGNGTHLHVKPIDRQTASICPMLYVL